MRQRLLHLAGVAVTLVIVSLAMHTATGQTPTAAGRSPAPTGKAAPAPKTVWGEPDLQGIWSRDADVPLQRPARYGNREFFTDAERAELDRQISGILARDNAESRRFAGFHPPPATVEPKPDRADVPYFATVTSQRETNIFNAWDNPLLAVIRQEGFATAFSWLLWDIVPADAPDSGM